MLWEVRIGFYFVDLLGMPVAVRSDEQDELVGVISTYREYDYMIAQVHFDIFNQRDQFFAASFKSGQRFRYGLIG